MENVYTMVLRLSLSWVWEIAIRYLTDRWTFFCTRLWYPAGFLLCLDGMNTLLSCRRICVIQKEKKTINWLMLLVHLTFKRVKLVSTIDIWLNMNIEYMYTDCRIHHIHIFSARRCQIKVKKGSHFKVNCNKEMCKKKKTVLMVWKQFL